MKEIKIDPKIGLGDVKLKMTSQEVQQSILGIDSEKVVNKINGKEYIEKWGSYKLHYVDKKVEMISVEGFQLILLEDEKIDLINTSNQFLSKENPFLDYLGNYIFPHYNIAINGLEENGNGIEITMYSDKFKNFYEDNIKYNVRYLELKSTHEMNEITYNVIPYTSVGPLHFEMSHKNIETILGKPEKINKMNNGILIENRGDIQTRYNQNDELIQVKLGKKQTVILQGELITEF
ncbi:hypothetical protein P4H71_19580 [Paenibacillus kribbensis]|uniref:hypothetical protein n=1 Tax=Paenibacillus kribbensis TaxID=172713 RepID=UPI002DB62FC1|nr:hypothetical protein [Paenibacillus kribbensis]MEC0236531.1 hypothetical protein [Paenibacillus kribbensis]